MSEDGEVLRMEWRESDRDIIIYLEKLVAIYKPHLAQEVLAEEELSVGIWWLRTMHANGVQAAEIEDYLRGVREALDLGIIEGYVRDAKARRVDTRLN